ncbi:ABC-three component system middle component 6 [Achromobacter sp. ES-001]|uniref:ABC-three component system middle component 6 n=1 Tax=Achromobacter sp. ES-001 TaxID=2860286 RepID=UPI00351CBE2A
MLLPDKHVKFSESLIGLGSHILELLDRPKTIDELWTVFESSCTHGSYPSKHSFENFVLAIDTLFAIGAIEETERSGTLRRCA